MIVTELYNGQGLGNQLWCYFVTRIIAYKNGFEFGIQSPHKFKGKEFLSIDFGNQVIGGSGPEGGPPNSLPNGITKYYRESINRHPNGLDISKMDNTLISIEDNTKLDGNMQSVRYIKDYKDLIRSWIKIDKESSYVFTDDLCIIHIRGGDFRFSSAFLNKGYYDNSIKQMLNKNQNMKFAIVTDDVTYSNSIYPDIPIIGGSSTGSSDTNMASHHIGGPIWMDWDILSKANNVIMSASSFSFWPVYLNDNAYVIAPMYWADYNKSDGYWSCGDSIVDGWNYIDRNGLILNSEECLIKKKEYEEKNKNFWI